MDHNDFVDLTFHFKDLVIIGGILIPALTAYIWMKFKIQSLENRFKQFEKLHSGFKKTMYEKLESNHTLIQNLQLLLSDFKNEMLERMYEMSMNFKIKPK